MLNILDYLKSERDFLPWSVFLNRIKYFNDILDSTELYGDLKKFLATLIEPYYKKLGWFEKNEDEFTEK